jgi:hypothetical protein
MYYLKWFLTNIIGIFLRSIKRASYVSPSIEQVLISESINSSAKFVIENCVDANFIPSGREFFFDFVKKFMYSNNYINSQSQILEFGVWRGRSIKYLARIFPDNTVIGFDSFQGLSENWSGTEKFEGHFSTDGKVPRNLPKNVKIIVGLFSETLPNFLKNFEGDLSLCHLDADTYTPTKEILELVVTPTRQNLVLIFDEYFGYPNWEIHEHRAFQEIIKKTGRKFKYIAYTQQSVAVLVL